MGGYYQQQTILTTTRIWSVIVTRLILRLGIATHTSSFPYACLIEPDPACADVYFMLY